MRRMKNKLQMPLDADEILLPPPLLSRPSVAVRPWIELPVDVTANILRRLEVFEILECAQLVCTTWWKVCQDPAMWRVIKIVSDDFSMSDDCSLWCLRAMDRSKGHLLDLTIAYFGSHVLLLYIANRSSHLKRLTLVLRRGVKISLTSFTEAVRKLPRLEELHLTSSSRTVLGDFVAFAISCSKLTSFSLNCPFSHDEGELSTSTLIAKNMSNLCHLGLLGNDLNNEGLEVILDGCPRLESLDLRRCFKLDLGGALGKRCRVQLKNLRLPFDSMEDWEWNRDAYYSDDPDDYYFYHDVDYNDMSD